MQDDAFVVDVDAIVFVAVVIVLKEYVFFPHITIFSFLQVTDNNESVRADLTVGLAGCHPFLFIAL